MRSATHLVGKRHHSMTLIHSVVAMMSIFAATVTMAAPHTATDSAYASQSAPVGQTTTKEAARIERSFESVLSSETNLARGLVRELLVSQRAFLNESLANLHC